MAPDPRNAGQGPSSFLAAFLISLERATIPHVSCTVALRRGSQRASFTVVTTSSRAYPSDVTEPPAANAPLIVPALSEAAARRARSRGWSAIPDDGPAWVLLHGRELKLKRPELATGSQQQSRRGRSGWGIFSVFRAFRPTWLPLRSP